MKKLSKVFILFFIAILLTFFILMIFKPIFTAKSLIFPYCVHPFDIHNLYPKFWFYFKQLYCILLFINILVFINFLSNSFNFKVKSSKTNANNLPNLNNKSQINLLVGIDSKTQEKIFINEKGLYQNILVTGTIRLSGKQVLFCTLC